MRVENYGPEEHHMDKEHETNTTSIIVYVLSD